MQRRIIFLGLNLICRRQFFQPKCCRSYEILHFHTNTCDSTVLMVVMSCPVGIRLHGVTNLETLIIAVVLLQLFQNKETFNLFHVSIHIREIKNLNIMHKLLHVFVPSFILYRNYLLVTFYGTFLGS